MDKIRKINVFVPGDSSLLNTWSNIPYLLTMTLEKQGYIVTRINIEPNHFFQKFWNNVLFRVISKFFRNTIYWYDRTLICYIETFIRIWFQNRKYNDADLNLFVSYSFYNPFSSKPNVLLSDWDYETMIKEKRLRNPYFFEKWSIKRQKKIIQRADLVISLFSSAAEDMRVRYNKSNIVCLGKNVINVFFDREINENEILERKQISNKLLFIGSIKYFEGAKLLIDSYSRLKPLYPLLELVIIGIGKEYFPALPEGVTCYGYLDKGNKKENERYYDELINARVIINATPVWAGYSSTIEGMYFYTPVIVSPYSDFVNEFGKELDFGFYCQEFDVNSLKETIELLFQRNDYQQLCVNAREKVKEYTWENYVTKLMTEINNLQ